MIAVNGTPLESMGIEPLSDGVHGWSDGLSLEYPALERAGEGGPIESDTPTARPREVEIKGKLTTTTLAGRGAVLQSALIKMRGRVELNGFDDHADMVLLARLDSVVAEGLGSDTAGLEGTPLTVRLRFRAFDPRWRSEAATVVSFDATAAVVPMGTAPHEGVIQIAGAATNPVITVRDFRGIEVASLEFTGALASDEAWIIDLRDHSVTLSDSGVESAAGATVSGGAFWEFDPDWAGYDDASWPTIEVSDGEGTLIYYRRWRV